MRKGFGVGAVIGYIIGSLIRLMINGMKTFIGLFTKRDGQDGNY